MQHSETLEFWLRKAGSTVVTEYVALPWKGHIGKDTQSQWIVLVPFNQPANLFKVTDSHEEPWVNMHRINHDAHYCETDTQETQEDYCSKLEKVIAELKVTGGKAVISRAIDIHCHINPKEAFYSLCAKYPASNVFYWKQADKHWVGATPELLLQAGHGRLCTMSLAGTRPNSSKAPWDQKNIEEQQIVTDYLHNILSEHHLSVGVSPCTTLLAPPVEHLCTRLSAPFCGNMSDILALADSLAPTPAVAGFPVEDALARIARYEPHDREYYSGYFGVLNAYEAFLYVTLRCMSIDQAHDTARLYAGGGITALSDPHAEWEETCHKADTILKALNINTSNNSNINQS